MAEKNELVIEGRVVDIFPAQSGTTQANKPWRKQSFLIETEGQFPKKAVFECWNDLCDKIPTVIGTKVEVGFNIDTREYNSKYYTTLSAWRVFTKDKPSGAPKAETVNNGFNPNPPVDDSSDLPF